MKRSATLERATVCALAADVLTNDMAMPILVRPGGDRFVPVEGPHQPEAANWRDPIAGYRVSLRKH